MYIAVIAGKEEGGQALDPPDAPKPGNLVSRRYTCALYHARQSLLREVQRIFQGYRSQCQTLVGHQVPGHRWKP